MQILFKAQNPCFDKKPSSLFKNLFIKTFKSKFFPVPTRMLLIEFCTLKTKKHQTLEKCFFPSISTHK